MALGAITICDSVRSVTWASCIAVKVHIWYVLRSGLRRVTGLQRKGTGSMRTSRAGEDETRALCSFQKMLSLGFQKEKDKGVGGIRSVGGGAAMLALTSSGER